MTLSGGDRDPIAIVGMGCRLPGGVADPRSFWRLLVEERDAIGPVPKDRFSVERFYDPDGARPGKTWSREGGFVAQSLEDFDPLFFGISPREAEVLDPQQRLLLEVTWEAFDDAGLRARDLAGSGAGVFVGAFSLDQHAMHLSPFNLHLVDARMGTGSGMTLLANRLSYVFDLRGPSMTIDTACSSSLVAVHLACQALWSGECALSFAGGANAVFNPPLSVVMSKGRFLSPRSRCMAFDERAAGYVRGEGAGMVVLKPLRDAERDGDRVYALILATSVNHDGKTPGVSLPSQAAQAALARDVLRKAGVPPRAIRFVEAHGTGTQAGDPIEALALDSVLREGRAPGDKCLVGSVKTNIGHLEAAAGVAGLMKAALCLTQSQVPRSLHFEKANPNIPFDDLCLRVATSLTTLDGQEPAHAAINSFGYGGANAHAVLKEAPREPLSRAEDPAGAFLYPLSARSPAALRTMASRLAERLEDHDAPALADVAYTLSQRRTHHVERLAVVASARQELAESLRAVGKGEPDVRAVFGRSDGEARGPAFVYTGMGPMWWAMGRELLGAEPVFRRAIEECDALLSPVAGWSILEELTRSEEASRMRRAEVAQPCNLAVQVALTEVWRAWGVWPAAVLGHSVGEVAAAWASGALPLDDALRLSFERGRLQQTQAGKGGMLAVGLGEAEVAQWVDPHPWVVIAAINSPSSTTLAGDGAQLDAVEKVLEAQGVFCRRMQVDIAFHGPHMDCLKDDFLRATVHLAPRTAMVAFYSTVTGEPLQGDEVDADYWWQNVRAPVRFQKAVTRAIDDGHRVFLEVGPHPVLSAALRDCARARKVQAAAWPSLRRGEPERAQMLSTAGALHTSGLPLDWSALTPPHGKLVSLPTYPWQRERHWCESKRSREFRLGSAGHPFLRERCDTLAPTFAAEASPMIFSFLPDHTVDGAVVFPGAGWIEAGLAMHAVTLGGEPDEPRVLEGVRFVAPLVVKKEVVQVIHVSAQPEESTWSASSRPTGDDPQWVVHATGRMLPGRSTTTPRAESLAKVRARCPAEIDRRELYEALGRRGLGYEKQFRTMQRIWSGQGEVLVELAMDGEPGEMMVHPTLLDGAFQAIGALDPGGDSPVMPAGVERVVFWRRVGRRCFGHFKLTRKGEIDGEGDVTLYEEDGAPALELTRVRYRVLTEAQRGARGAPRQDWYYAFDWLPVPAPARAPAPKRWLVFAAGDDLGESIVRRLSTDARVAAVARPGNAYAKEGEGSFVLRPGQRADVEQMLAELAVEGPPQGVLYLWGLPVAALSLETTVARCAELAAVLTALVEPGDSDVRFVAVTRGTQIVEPEDRGPGVVSAVISGIVPLLGNEHARFSGQVIDLSRGDLAEQDLLLAELEGSGEETDVALRGERRFARRVSRATMELEPQPIVRDTETAAVRLLPGRRRSIEGVSFHDAERRAPGEGEVEIHVHTAGLNFKDVLKALGWLDPEVTRGTMSGEDLGMECSGVVTAVGPGVADLSPGDAVVAILPRALGSFVTGPATFVARVPSTLDLSNAAVLFGYVVAYHSLLDVARLEPGETVLVHHATGGVGLACVQIAAWRGATVMATAGSDEKRAHLTSLGVKHVFSSRDLDFAAGVREATGGRGVDVVIGAVAGDAIAKGVACLAPHGRYIELGKAEIMRDAPLPLGRFNENLTFSSVDLDRLFLERPARVRRAFLDCCRLFEEKVFTPIPVERFPAPRVVDAFRQLAAGKHVGKVLVELRDEKVSVPAPDALPIRADGTYLVTGGTSGLGLELARWLVHRGARSLVLVSRRGADSRELATVLPELSARGADVLVESVDVTDLAALERLLDRVRSSRPKLRGVFHGAMVLDDGFLVNLTPQRFRRVLAPKVAGCLHLDRATEEDPLDLFVCFSSFVAVTGNAGQANYTAANAFLDAFCAHRRARGLPATAVNLGALAGAGVMERNPAARQVMEITGVRGIPCAAALDALAPALRAGKGQVSILDIDWRRWQATNPKAARSSRLADFLNSASAAPADSARVSLEDLSPEARRERVHRVVVEALGGVLRLATDRIEARHRISDLGIDSLMALELKYILEYRLGVGISTPDLLKGPAVSELVSTIISAKELARASRP